MPKIGKAYGQYISETIILCQLENVFLLINKAIAISNSYSRIPAKKFYGLCPSLGIQVASITLRITSYY